MKLVIVGGVAGGASAAARARRLSESAQIVMFERGPDPSFANCGLPYHVGEVIPKRESLLVAKPVQLSGRLRLDVRTRSEVESIDREAKTVRIHNLATGERYDEPYDKLILAPGAAPLRPPIPGIDLPGVFTLRNLQDTDRIKQTVDSGIQQAVIVGAGFIGLELAENLVHRGVSTTIVELQDQVLPPLDREMTTPILDRLKAHGITVHLGDSAEAFEPAANGLTVRLKSGATLPAQLVVLGIGVRPENGLAVAAGLEVGPRGGIKVDEYMRTADPDIFAVGDAVEIAGYVLGGRTQVPLAGPANRQGRIAADNALGRNERYRGTQATAILGLFGLTAACTGETEKTLKRAGIPFEKIYIHPANHAGYYPGARPMSLKLLFQPNTGRILGAQIVGEEGVDKRIDVLAVAIQARMSVFNLEEVELAYAPQFGSAKDPINMAGFVASNVARGDTRVTHVDALPAPGTIAGPETPFVLDVRTPEEFAAGAVPGAVNLPLETLREHLGQVPRDRPIIAYCQVGQRGYLATRLLQQLGYNVANLSGGYKTYRLVTPAS